MSQANILCAFPAYPLCSQKPFPEFLAFWWHSRARVCPRTSFSASVCAISISKRSLVAVQGFQQQTKSWPEQPLDSAIRWLKKQPKKARVADFGCGDAGLARAVSQQVASLDLVATSPEVTACDMGATPLGEPGIPTPICFVKGVESVAIVMEINFG